MAMQSEGVLTDADGNIVYPTRPATTAAIDMGGSFHAVVPPPPPPPPQCWVVPLCIVVNLCSSIGIMFTNKVLFQIFEYKFSTLMTVMHYLATFVLLWILRTVFRVFQAKPLRWRHVLPLSTTSIMFVVFSNLSLTVNGPHFYQMTRVLTAPCVFLITTVVYGEQQSTRMAVLVGLTMLGALVAVFTTDAVLSTRGVAVAAAAVLTTSLYQVWVGAKQKELECDAWQLLYYQSPMSAAILLPFVPLLDQVDKLPHLPVREGALVTIVCSCGLAFLVSLTLYLIVGRTSPLVYSALGHLKLVMVAAVM